MNNKIGVALIGAGRAGMIHAKNIAFHSTGARMVCVADANLQNAIKAAEELECDYTVEYDTVFSRPDVDAVIVAVPTKFHHDVVVKAAACKKHILCEKPMAMNVKECQDMIDAAAEHNVILQIGFMRRFDASFLQAKAMIDSGAIGDVVMVKSLTHGPSVPHEWMYDIGKSNGPLAEVNSHDIDTLRWLTGGEAATVYAMAGNYRCKDARSQYPDFYDSVLMSVRMSNGMMGCIDGAQGVEYGYDARVDILGTKGLITIGDLKDSTTLLHTKEGGIQGEAVKSWMNLFSDAYIKEDESFVKCIQNSLPPEVSGWDGMMAVAVVTAGNQSILTGEVINL